MTEKDIQAKMFRKFKHKYVFLNTFFFSGECDWISFLHSGYCYEIEVKTSKADFLRDFKKKKHSIMSALHKTKRPSDLDKKAPNKFYFICPEGVVEKKDVPAYAGLYVVSKWGNIKKVKEAPFLHKTKLRPERTFKKLYYLYQKMLMEKLFG